MTVRSTRRTLPGASVLTGLLLFLAIALSPVAHHDLLCHARSPVHCNACTSGVSTPGSVGECVTVAVPAIDAGLATSPSDAVPPPTRSGGTTGRSPPHA